MAAKKCTPKCSRDKGISRRSKRFICNPFCDDHLGSYVKSQYEQGIGPKMAAKWLQNGSEKVIWRLPGRLSGRLGRLGTLWHASGRLILLGGGLPTRHYSRIPRLVDHFWVILGLLLGAFLNVFLLFCDIAVRTSRWRAKRTLGSHFFRQKQGSGR